MDARGVEVLPATLPGATLGLSRRMLGFDECVLRWIVILPPAGRLHDAQMPAGVRRLEMERQIAIVALARDDGRTAVEYPDVGHVGALLERADLHVGRRAVEQYARAPLCVMAGHHAPDRLDVVRHRLRPRWNEWKSAAPSGTHGFFAMAYMSLTTSMTTGFSSAMARLS